MAGFWYGRILVLPNYPRLANFPSVSSSRPDGPPVMLYVGSLTERRGILVMLEALRLLRKSFDVRLMIAGGFYDDNLEQKCRAFDREHDLQVEWLGWVDHRELAGVVSQASLGLSLLQPTERYLKGLPTKIFFRVPDYGAPRPFGTGTAAGPPDCVVCRRPVSRFHESRDRGGWHAGAAVPG